MKENVQSQTLKGKAYSVNGKEWDRAAKRGGWGSECEESMRLHPTAASAGLTELKRQKNSCRRCLSSRREWGATAMILLFTAILQCDDGGNMRRIQVIRWILKPRTYSQIVTEFTWTAGWKLLEWKERKLEKKRKRIEWKVRCQRNESALSALWSTTEGRHCWSSSVCGCRGYLKVIEHALACWHSRQKLRQNSCLEESSLHRSLYRYWDRADTTAEVRAALPDETCAELPPPPKAPALTAPPPPPPPHEWTAQAFFQKKVNDRTNDSPDSRLPQTRIIGVMLSGGGQISARHYLWSTILGVALEASFLFLQASTAWSFDTPATRSDLWSQIYRHVHQRQWQNEPKWTTKVYSPW